MQDNPYFELVRFTKDEAREVQKDSFLFGEVISVNPLRVIVNDTVQDKDSLKKADGMEFKKGDAVLLAVTDEENDLIILCKIVDV